MKNLYVGAAGVVWALDVLQKRGHAEMQLDLADAAARTLAAWRREPDFMSGMELPAQRQSSLLCGETGILVVAWRLAPSRELADDLFARVEENTRNDVERADVGLAGDDDRGARDGRLDGRAALARRVERERRCARGRARRGRLLDAAPLRRYGALPRPGPRATSATSSRSGRARGTTAVPRRPCWRTERLSRTASPTGRRATGRETTRSASSGATALPGSSSPLPTTSTRSCSLAAAELTWRAGPLGPEKGCGLCHGTAGNGYAFLKAFARTGDELWLDRARRFAMHALGQVEQRGHGRYSLWTGDLGVALYAADCLDGRSAYPVLDTWD